MSEFVNQTHLDVDKSYPQRQILADHLTSWDIFAPDYSPPLPKKPDFDIVQKRLEEAGLLVDSPEELDNLVKLETAEAVGIFGEVVASLRHPLGRTGINGTGIFNKAGASLTADMVLMRFHPDYRAQVALAFTRNKWSLPGGFVEPGEEADRRLSAVREAWEEISIDLRECSLSDEDGFMTLVDGEVKPRSPRAADFGWINNEVTGHLLADYTDGDSIAPGTVDDRETITDARWFSIPEVGRLKVGVEISPDHCRYISRGVRKLVFEPWGLESPLPDPTD